MYDRWEYTIPADTAEKDAKRVPCHITKGFLRSISLFMPSGCWNYVRCRVFVGERPIVPRSPANFIALNGVLERITYLNEPVWEDIPVLNWDVWNLDDTYDHTIWMSAEWLSEEKPYEMKMAHQMEEFLALMRNLVGV